MTFYHNYDTTGLIPFCFQVSPLGNIRGYLRRWVSGAFLVEFLMTGVLYSCNLLTGLVNILDLISLNYINFRRGHPVVL